MVIRANTALSRYCHEAIWYFEFLLKIQNVNKTREVKDKVCEVLDSGYLTEGPVTRKFITTGEGGLITTTNPEWADWMLSYKHFGMGVHDSRISTDFARIGSNYKLSNILAAVGLVQMNHMANCLTADWSCLQIMLSSFKI